MIEALLTAASVVVAVGVCVWFVVMFARFGIAGTWDAMMDRVRPIIERLMYGPPAEPSIAELEADVAPSIEQVVADAERRALQRHGN